MILVKTRFTVLVFSFLILISNGCLDEGTSTVAQKSAQSIKFIIKDAGSNPILNESASIELRKFSLDLRYEITNVGEDAANNVNVIANVTNGVTGQLVDSLGWRRKVPLNPNDTRVMKWFSVKPEKGMYTVAFTVCSDNKCDWPVDLIDEDGLVKNKDYFEVGLKS
jgi:hypothetical protein